jgi:GTPase SAR1 family protein
MHQMTRPRLVTEFTDDIVVGLMGLPSAGKSSAVNALCGKRLRQSGVCRTTKNVHLIGTMERCRELVFPEEHFTKHALVSDDGVPFSLLDFPGVADIEDTNDLFSAMTIQWGLACDVICWVSDIRTSFMTVHEQSEFNRISETIQKASRITGRLYQFCILLAKYDVDDESKEPNYPTTVFNDEILDPEEETTILDCLVRVEGLFPHLPIAKFNAFGRIAHGESSDALRALLARVPPP